MCTGGHVLSRHGVHLIQDRGVCVDPRWCVQHPDMALGGQHPTWHRVVNTRHSGGALGGWVSLTRLSVMALSVLGSP